MYHEHLPGFPLFCPPSKFEIWMEKEGSKIIELILISPVNECFICKVDKNITTHHIIPIHCGGLDIITNRVRLCDSCHKKVHLFNRDQKTDIEWFKLIINLRNQKVYKAASSNNSNNKEEK